MRSWLSVDNAVNLRDVGGLPGRGGGTTRHLLLLRSGSLRLLGPDDARVLLSVYGVGTVVDLRTAREVAADGPSVLAHAGVATLHLPLVDDVERVLPEATGADPVVALRNAYRGYLDERGHHLVTLARLVAGSTTATLVHCAAGKDRTGVAVAVLLDAVGIERSAVVADYVATNDVIEDVVRTLAAAYGYTGAIQGVDRTAHLARPAVLTELLERLDADHGGAAGWLREHGLAEHELTALRGRLVRATPPG